MSKEKAIEKIQYAVMQVASVYACSAIFDEKTKVIEGRQKELEKAIVNLHDALKELEGDMTKFNVVRYWIHIPMELLQLAIQKKRQKRYVMNIVETANLCTTI